MSFIARPFQKLLGWVNRRIDVDPEPINDPDRRWLLEDFPSPPGLPRSFFTVLYGWGRFFLFLSTAIVALTIYEDFDLRHRLGQNLTEQEMTTKGFNRTFGWLMTFVLMLDSILTPDDIWNNYVPSASYLYLTKIPKNVRVGMLMVATCGFDAHRFNVFVDVLMDKTDVELYDDFLNNRVEYVLLFARLYLLVGGILTLIWSFIFPDSTMYNEKYWSLYGKRWYEKSELDASWANARPRVPYNFMFMLPLNAGLFFVKSVVPVFGLMFHYSEWMEQYEGDIAVAGKHFIRDLWHNEEVTYTLSQLGYIAFGIGLLVDAVMQVPAQFGLWQPHNQTQNYRVLHMWVIFAHFFYLTTLFDWKGHDPDDGNEWLLWSWGAALSLVSCYILQEIFIGQEVQALQSYKRAMANKRESRTWEVYRADTISLQAMIWRIPIAAVRQLPGLIRLDAVQKAIQTIAVVTGTFALMAFFVGWLGPWLRVEADTGTLTAEIVKVVGPVVTLLTKIYEAFHKVQQTVLSHLTCDFSDNGNIYSNIASTLEDDALKEEFDAKWNNATYKAQCFRYDAKHDHCYTEVFCNHKNECDTDQECGSEVYPPKCRKTATEDSTCIFDLYGNYKGPTPPTDCNHFIDQTANPEYTGELMLEMPSASKAYTYKPDTSTDQLNNFATAGFPSKREKKCRNDRCTAIMVVTAATVVAQVAAAATSWIPIFSAGSGTTAAIATATEYTAQVFDKGYRFVTNIYQNFRRFIGRLNLFKKSVDTYKIFVSFKKFIVKSTYKTLYGFIQLYITGFISWGFGFWRRMRLRKGKHNDLFNMLIAITMGCVISNAAMTYMMMYLPEFVQDKMFGNILPSQLIVVKIIEEPGYKIMKLACQLSTVSSVCWLTVMILEKTEDILDYVVNALGAGPKKYNPYQLQAGHPGFRREKLEEHPEGSITIGAKKYMPKITFDPPEYRDSLGAWMQMAPFLAIIGLIFYSEWQLDGGVFDIYRVSEPTFMGRIFNLIKGVAVTGDMNNVQNHHENMCDLIGQAVKAGLAKFLKSFMGLLVDGIGKVIGVSNLFYKMYNVLVDIGNISGDSIQEGLLIFVFSPAIAYIALYAFGFTMYILGGFLPMFKMSETTGVWTRMMMWTIAQSGFFFLLTAQTYAQTIDDIDIPILDYHIKFTQAILYSQLCCILIGISFFQWWFDRIFPPYGFLATPSDYRLGSVSVSRGDGKVIYEISDVEASKPTTSIELKPLSISSSRSSSSKKLRTNWFKGNI